TGVKGISRQGRPSQGVTLMNLREDDRVSAVALVMEDEADTSAAALEALEDGLPAGEVEASVGDAASPAADPDDADVDQDANDDAEREAD
nr:hypothetical protein [Thermoleophilaceae bacterium]